jgi:hypothetical protein
MVLNLKDIANQIRNDESCIASKSFPRTVHFCFEDTSAEKRQRQLQLQQINEDPEIKTALLNFLNFFATIATLTFPDRIQIQSDDDLKHALSRYRPPRVSMVYHLAKIRGRNRRK